MDNHRIKIFDTILRDGEQADHPMSIATKVAIASRLERLGVDVIEVGFPVSSPGEIEATRQISQAISEPTICVLARIVKKDIEAAARSLELAKKGRIHVFASTSDFHIKKKLQSTREKVLDLVREEVRRARTYCADVEFSAEDATRTDMTYLLDVVEAAADAGATTINIPDTVGYAQVDEYGETIDQVWRAVSGHDDVLISVHCHNDLGLAVANSLNGVLYGADQVEGCFLGIGERAGNAALEQVIMALHTRSDIYNNVKTNIDFKELWPFLNFLSDIIDYPIPDHQAIAGKYAFSHSSGIHRDGVLKDRQTYEIMKPEDIGWRGAGVTLVSHLGEAGLADYLLKLGYADMDLAACIIGEFKLLGNSIGRMSDEDIHLLIQEYKSRKDVKERNLFTFDDRDINFSSLLGVNESSVTLERGGFSMHANASGDGPIDAVCNAIDHILKVHEKIDMDNKEVQFNIVHGSGGSEALGSVRARVKIGDKIGFGRATDLNLVKAYARAYLDAFNHLIHVPISEEKETLRKVYN